MKQPLVSVLMNCFNSERYLREAIDSVCAQTYNHWEIIFWDNASKDGSASIVKNYKDPRIRYFRGEKTIPLYAARNKALEQCRGEYIAFLDCDDIWMPQKLEKQIPLFKDPKVGLVYSDSLFFDNNGFAKRNYSTKRPCVGKCFSKLLRRYHLDIEAVVIRKSTLVQFKLKFDDRFNYVGDADLFLRLAWHSELSMVPEVLAKWRIHENSLTNTCEAGFLDELELMISKLMEQLRGIIPKYDRDLMAAKNNIILKRAFLKWRDLGGASARIVIRSIDDWNLNAYLLLICTYLPFKLVYSLIRKFR